LEQGQLRTIPTEIVGGILDNGSATPTSVLQKSIKGENMNDPEVARLRRLRDTALRSRAIARALIHDPDPSLERAACASWRIARAASGRLTTHPYPKYQYGPTLRSVLSHAMRGRYVALTRRSRAKALAQCEAELRQLARLVADVRAVTLAPDLSETLGRAQWELDSVLTSLEREARSGAPEARGPARVVEPAAATLAPPLGTDWPYLAL
jgi:hypothetical protein